MERQRSFSFKPTRLLVFCFTISSSVVFLTIFSTWFIKTSPSSHRETHLLLDSDNHLIIHTFTGFTSNFSGNSWKDPILMTTRSSSPATVNGLDQVSGPKKENQSDKVAVEKAEDALSWSGDVTAHELNVSGAPLESHRDLSDERIEENKGKVCDITKGKWVFDESYPLYTNASCPYIDEGFNCVNNGRLDKEYMKWRWQPQDCDIPRFNASKMLELIRGKRLVFIGDSINRNQWESMLCMLMGAIKDPKKVYETHRRKITKEKGNYSFRFVDYKCTVEYYVSHFLVHESKARVGQKWKQILRIDSVDRGSSRWRNADIVVFNTAHWWSHFKTKAGINYYQEGGQVHPRLDVSVAFRRALMTWASWAGKNLLKSKVFFRSSAPSHFSDGQWNSGGHCKEARHPINQTLHKPYPEKNKIAEEVLKQMQIPVTFLNITGLSEYRRDGHPSTYGRTRTQGQRTSGIQDCSHWCLPGVPDTWNELLYFHLLKDEEQSHIL